MSIAVVIPARNAAHLLTECVAAINAQDRPADEIWIVVGPSDDDTASVAAHLAAGRSTLRLLDNGAGDRASALNLVIGRTTADLVAFVDAQASLASDYLSSALKALAETDAAAVGGPMRPVGQTAVGRAMAAALQSPFGVGDSQFHFVGQAREQPSVYLGVYRTDVFERIGVYNTGLLRTEDDDLNARLGEDGMRIWLDPAIRSTYRCRESLSGVWGQYFGYGYWKVALATLRPGAIRARHLVPAAFVLVLALAAVVSVIAWWPSLPVLLAAYLLAAWVASLMIAGSPGGRLLFPAVTATMHVAYGIGTWRGLASWSRLARKVRAGADAASAPPRSAS